MGAGARACRRRRRIALAPAARSVRKGAGPFPVASLGEAGRTTTERSAGTDQPRGWPVANRERQMDRRTFLKGIGSAAGVVLLPSFAAADQNRIDWYTSSDTNVLDFWSNFVKPKFEAAHPGITMNLVDGGDGGGLQAIAERALAAVKAKADPHA